MRHTIIIATLSSVAASVLTTAVIGGSFLGANTADSANTPGEAITVQPGEVESILQGDVDCDSDVGTRDSQGILRYVLQQPALSQDEPCPDIATVIPAGEGVPGPQGPQGEQGPPGEQGATGPSGISEFAHVTTDGSVLFGTAISAEKDQLNSYIVTFGRNLDGCVATASQGRALDTGGFNTNVRLRHVIVGGVTREPTQVSVGFADVDTGTTTPTGFHVIVVC